MEAADAKLEILNTPAAAALNYPTNGTGEGADSNHSPTKTYSGAMGVQGEDGGEGRDLLPVSA